MCERIKFDFVHYKLLRYPEDTSFQSSPTARDCRQFIWNHLQIPGYRIKHSRCYSPLSIHDSNVVESGLGYKLTAISIKEKRMGIFI
jgi:hypothetical protein